MRDADGTYAITGGCRCGGIRYRITNAPLFVMACHCTDCQEQTSSAFSLGMPVDKDGFSHTGEPVVITKTAESGNESRAYLGSDVVEHCAASNDEPLCDQWR